MVKIISLFFLATLCFNVLATASTPTPTPQVIFIEQIGDMTEMRVLSGNAHVRIKDEKIRQDMHKYPKRYAFRMAYKTKIANKTFTPTPTFTTTPTGTPTPTPTITLTPMGL